MVGVLVNDDLIATPVPVRDDVVIERSDVPEEIAEPEALPVSPSQRECTSKATAEVPVCPWLSEVIMCIVAAAIMSYPSIALRVNVRYARMTFPVHGNMVLRCGRSEERRVGKECRC